jgi:hypothetical protein
MGGDFNRRVLYPVLKINFLRGAGIEPGGFLNSSIDRGKSA